MQASWLPHTFGWHRLPVRPRTCWVAASDTQAWWLLGFAGARQGRLGAAALHARGQALPGPEVPRWRGQPCWRPRLHATLPAHATVRWQCPPGPQAQRPADAMADCWLAAAQALDLPPEEVCWQAEPARPGAQPGGWAVPRRTVLDLQQGLHRLGWRLGAIEPEAWSAQRAWAALQGGWEALLGDAPQDWRWQDASDTSDPQRAPIEEVQARVPLDTWRCLCASGLGLGVWQSGGAA